MALTRTRMNHSDRPRSGSRQCNEETQPADRGYFPTRWCSVPAHCTNTSGDPARGDFSDDSSPLRTSSDCETLFCCFDTVCADGNRSFSRQHKDHYFIHGFKVVFIKFHMFCTAFFLIYWIEFQNNKFCVKIYFWFDTWAVNKGNNNAHWLKGEKWLVKIFMIRAV